MNLQADAAPGIVTAAPPTPNGELHLGHLSGPYSGADIFARARRVFGGDSWYVTGSDIHQSYVPVKARQLGKSVDLVSEEYASEIEGIFRLADFRLDVYSRPLRSAHHLRMVHEFFATLHANGRLREVTRPGLYCANCDRYLFEAHVTGGCPWCGNRSDGNSCEICARHNAVVDLVAPRCNGCGREPVVASYRQLVLPLRDYADVLATYYERATLSPPLRDLCLGMLADGLPDIPVTHPTDWGIRSQLPGFTDQRFYVWAEMVPGYFASVQEACDAYRPGTNWRQVWDASPEVVQFFGFDNGYFHAVLFPALMSGYDPRLRLPDTLIANEFYLLDDQKFSTSRRHAVWARTLLQLVSADVVRFVLAHDRPEVAPSNFSWSRFVRLGTEELAETWQPWLNELLGHVSRQYGGRMPATNHIERSLLDDLASIARRCQLAYSAKSFSPQTAARQLVELVRVARAHRAAHRRGRHNRPGSALDRAATAGDLLAVKVLAQLAAPLMPSFAARLWSALGCAGEPKWDALAALPEGQRVTEPQLFFEPLPADLPVLAMAADRQAVSSAGGRDAHD